MDANVKLSREDGELIEDSTQYRKLFGKLLYLYITRPDLSYVVTYLSQFMDKPRLPHLKAVYRVLHYVKGSVAQALSFKVENDVVFKAFSDAN